MQKLYLSMACLLAFALAGFTMTSNVSADAAPGDVIISIGEGLSSDQEDAVLDEMGVENKDDANIVYVSNDEEHNYLDGKVPKAQIGSRTISSAMIVLGESGDGLTIERNNIDYITEDMYGNALTTAGVTDAKIYVTAPFEVSGTGALTGIIKAYETSQGEKIDEDRKQTANEEMVLTADLSDDEDIGEDKASDLIQSAKKEVSEKDPATKEDLKEIIQNLADEKEIKLDDEQFDRLMNLLEGFKDLDINWDDLNQKVQDAKNSVSDFINSEEGQNFIDKIVDFFKSLWDSFTSIFEASDDGNAVESSDNDNGKQSADEKSTETSSELNDDNKQEEAVDDNKNEDKTTKEQLPTDQDKQATDESNDTSVDRLEQNGKQKEETDFDLKSYLSEQYAIKDNHYTIKNAGENSSTGLVDYNVYIKPDTDKVSQKISESIQDGDQNQDNSDVQKLFDTAENILNDVPKADDNTHINAVFWDSNNNDEESVLLIQDRAQSTVQ